MQTIWWVRAPHCWVCGNGGAVEEIAEEGGDEEKRGKAGGGFPDMVLVDLGKAGGEVAEGGDPGEDTAGCFEVTGRVRCRACRR